MQRVSFLYLSDEQLAALAMFVVTGVIVLSPDLYERLRAELHARRSAS